MTESHKYAEWVRKNPKKTGQLVKKAIDRFESDLKRDDIYFDEKEAERVVRFAQTMLCLWEGQWRGMNVTLYPWQIFVIQNLFAWKWKISGLRRFRNVYLQVSRKNGKTTFADIITAVHLFIDNDKTPQVLVGANNEDQAKICTNSLGRMLKISPAFHPYINDKKLNFHSYGDRIRGVVFNNGDRDGSVVAMSREPGTKDGFNPSLGIIDEYHEATDDALLNVIESGQGARREPMLVVITTAGYNKNGVCYQKMRKVSIDILENIVEDDTHFAMIYEQDKDDDWKDPKTWIKSNPMIEHIDTMMGYLETRMVKAINEGGSKEVDFKTKNLNTWCDAAEVWISTEIWVANHNPDITIDDLDGCENWGGIDLAQTRDLNSFSLTFELDLYGKQLYPVLNWNWIPEENVTYRGNNYLDFVREGYIFKTPGNHSDPAEMGRFITEKCLYYNTKRVHFDRYLAEWLAPLLAESGINVLPRAMGGYALSQSMKEMERIILAKLMPHFNNPVLKWANSNLMPKRDPNGNIRPTKENDANKIDPMVATILSFDAMVCDKAVPEQTVYIGGF